MEGRCGVLGFFVVLVFSFVIAHNGENHEEVGSPNLSYDSCVSLTTEYGFKLRWNLDLDNGTVNFAIESTGAGWVGIGISLDGEMSSGGKGSDMIVGWMDNKNTDCGLGCVKDYWASQDAQPQLDPQQDVTFILGELENGITRLEFSRKLKTGDAMDRDFPINKGFILLWAVGANPPKSFSQYEEHTAHGMVRIVLSTAYTCTSSSMSTHTSGHSLFFTASDSVIILFSGWETTNGGQYFGSLLVVILAAFIYEALVIFSPLIVDKFTDGQTKYLTNKQRALSTFLRVIQLGLAYLLMLISMTFDAGLFLSLLFGLGAAHACFFHRPWLRRQKDDEEMVAPPECH